MFVSLFVVNIINIILVCMSIISIALLVVTLCFLKANKEMKEGRDELNAKIEQVTKECEKAIASEKAKTEFVASMGHELRTPMNAITCAIELLSKGDNEQSKETYVSILQSSSESLMDIVNDILDFSKMTSGNMLLSENPYDLCKLVTDVRDSTSTRLQEKPIAFTVETDPSTPRDLIGDEARIKQILMNLLSNAIKYTMSGSIHLKISYERVAREMIDVSFAVSDTGCGISDSDREKIFDKFSGDLKDKKVYVEGSGLGLSICRQLTELMGGTLSVESEFGKGSTFVARIRQKVTDNNPIYTPRRGDVSGCIIWEENRYYSESLGKTLSVMGMSAGYVNDITDLETTLDSVKTDFLFVSKNKVNSAYSLASRISPSTCVVAVLGNDEEFTGDRNIPILRKPFILCDIRKILEDVALNRALGISDSVVFTAPDARVLLVDDNKVNLKVARALVDSFKIQTVAVDNGYEAIDLIKNGEKFDLIFMDHMMPGLDGIQTTQKIHELEIEEAQTPIVALTANTGGDIEEQFFASGMCDFLPKPVVIKQMHYILEKWLPKSKQIHTITQNNPTVSVSKHTDMFEPRKGLSEYWNDETIYKKVLETFLEKSEAVIKDIYECAEYDEQVKAVYTLGKLSASIGAPGFIEEIESIKDIAKIDSGKTLSLRFDKLKEDYILLRSSITKYLEGPCDCE